MDRTCEARDMDLLLFGPEKPDKPAVEKCTGKASGFIRDFALCKDCIEALPILVRLGRDFKKQKGKKK